MVIVFSARLQGAHPFDPTRLRLTSYLFMLTESVLLNRLAKKRRRTVGMAVLAAHHRDRTAEMDIEAMFPATPPLFVP